MSEKSDALRISGESIGDWRLGDCRLHAPKAEPDDDHEVEPSSESIDDAAVVGRNGRCGLCYGDGMALFFDAAWADCKLAELKLDRGALAAAAGLSREDLALIFTNQREATGAEIAAFAALLQTDLVEMSLRCGVAARQPAPADANPAARLDQLNARLDAIDNWLAEFERETRKTGSGD